MGCGALSKVVPHAIDSERGRSIPETVGKKSYRVHGAPESPDGDGESGRKAIQQKNHRQAKKGASQDEEGLQNETAKRRRSTSPLQAVADVGDGNRGESSAGAGDGGREKRSSSSMEGIRRTSATEGNKKRNIKDYYKLGKMIGKGGYAMVKQATSKETGEEFAIKIIRLPSLFHWKGTPREGILKEVDLLLNLDHPNVVKLYDFFEDGSKMYLVMELLRGGELLSALMKRGTYTEDDARFCFRQIIEGIHYLHSHQIVHRDLKLENVLLVEKDNLTQVKIADFGFAREVQSSNMLSTVCGTPIYVAPEVISNGKYTTAIDMWSSGIMLYILLGGYPPFYDESEPVLYDLIRNTTFNFDDPAWKSVSKSAKNLIQKLLVANPAKRPTAADVLNHRWLNKDKGKVVAETEKNLSATMQRLRKHVTLHKMRSAVKAIMWLNRLSNAVQLAERTRNEGIAEDEKLKRLDRRTSLPANLQVANLRAVRFQESSITIGESSEAAESPEPRNKLKRTRGSVGPPGILFAMGSSITRMESVTEQAETESRSDAGSDDGKSGNKSSAKDVSALHSTPKASGESLVSELQNPKSDLHDESAAISGGVLPGNSIDSVLLKPNKGLEEKSGLLQVLGGGLDEAHVEGARDVHLSVEGVHDDSLGRGSGRELTVEDRLAEGVKADVSSETPGILNERESLRLVGPDLGEGVKDVHLSVEGVHGSLEGESEKELIVQDHLVEGIKADVPRETPEVGNERESLRLVGADLGEGAEDVHLSVEGGHRSRGGKSGRASLVDGHLVEGVKADAQSVAHEIPNESESLRLSGADLGGDLDPPKVVGPSIGS